MLKEFLTSKPWVFDKHLVFKWFDFSVHTRNMRFTTTKFWVQLHGLPMNMMIPDTAIEIGETIGQVWQRMLRRWWGAHSFALGSK